MWPSYRRSSFPVCPFVPSETPFRICLKPPKKTLMPLFEWNTPFSGMMFFSYPQLPIFVFSSMQTIDHPQKPGSLSKLFLTRNGRNPPPKSDSPRSLFLSYSQMQYLLPDSHSYSYPFLGCAGFSRSTPLSRSPSVSRVCLPPFPSRASCMPSLCPHYSSTPLNSFRFARMLSFDLNQ